MGQVLTAGVGQNPARQASMKAGVAKETPALTINAVCGSGLKAVMLAAQADGNRADATDLLDGVIQVEPAMRATRLVRRGADSSVVTSRPTSESFSATYTAPLRPMTRSTGLPSCVALPETWNLPILR